jgi:tetratricopeptide (TPR) repeat protein
MCRRSMLTVLLAIALASGCSKPTPVPAPPSIDPIMVTPTPGPGPGGEVPQGGPGQPVLPADDYGRLHDRLFNSMAEPSRKERYDAALLDAISHIAEQKYNLALLDLQTAQGLDDTELVRGEIARVNDLLAQQETATKTVQDLQTVLKDGPADVVVPLSNDALKQFGGTDQGPALADVQRQAAILELAAASPEEQVVLRKRWWVSGKAALEDNNLRTAVLSFELALSDAPAEDPRRQELETVRGRLVRYDEQRDLANRLRRDRATLEDALPTLVSAQQAWDTTQVRSDLDEVRFALSRCRDRLAVADFEVRGDLGWPDAGRTVSDALLGGFKRRFDLVERGQLDRVLGELKLEGAALGVDDGGRREIGRLGRLKYLVVGSITPLNGVTVHARLVNVQTGLIEQSARLSAPTLDQLVNRLEVLARKLQMTDEQQLAFEAQLANEAVEIQPIAPLADNQAVPPAPQFLANQAPPPVVAFAGGPVPLGAPVEVVIEDLRRLPAPVLLAEPVLVVQPPPVLLAGPRGRLLALSLELGDNLFRRGRHREAHRHYELALQLSGGNPEVVLRLDRVRPYLPPPPPPAVIVTPPPLLAVNIGPGQLVVSNPFLVQPPPPPPPLVVVAPAPVLRPRVLVFNFLVNARPGLVPPFLGDWAADSFAGYFGPRYEVVDRGELRWYMARLGITLRDVLNDPGARWGLCQALNARYLVFGTIQETSSFDVTSLLIDAQTGAPTAVAAIHVQSHEELKLRLGELTLQLGATPAQQIILAQQGRRSEAALAQVRTLKAAGRFKEAVEVGQAAVLEYPDSIILRTLVLQVSVQQQQVEIDVGRRGENERRARALEVERRQQADLVQKSAAARLKAETEGKNRNAAAQERVEADRKRAYDALIKQGQEALRRKAYEQAVQNFRCAVALRAEAEGFQQLAQADKERDLAHQARALEEAKQKADAEAAAHAEAVTRLAEARKQQVARSAERRQHELDQAAKLTERARKDLSEGKVDEALSAARFAQSLNPTPEAERLVSQTEQARDLKLVKGEQQRKEIEANQKKQEAYGDAMKKGGEALSSRKYGEAVAQYDAAVKLFPTDAAVAGRNGARSLLERDKAAQEAEKNKAAEQERRTAEIKKLLGTARQRLEAHQFKEAESEYNLVLQLDPGNVEARSGKARVVLARADQDRTHAAEADRAQKQEQARVLLARGKADFDGKRYDSALTALNEAVKLDPTNAEASTFQKKAQDYRNAQARDEEQGRKRKADFDRLLAQGRTELGAKKYAEAAKTLTEAQKLIPDNADVKAYLGQAQQGLKKQENEGKVAELVAEARKAMAARDFPKAEGLLNQARPLIPGDADVTRASDELARARKPAPVDTKRKEDYELAMSAGADAVKKQNYPGAVNAYREALRIMPGDASATVKLEAATNLAFSASLEKGRTALKEQQADAALKNADEALLLKPGDKEATALRTSAQALKTSQANDGKKREELTRLVTSGKAALAAKKPEEAIKDADEALKLVPGDKEATTLRLVAVGRTAFNAQKYEDALKSAADALKLVPSDAAASALQKEATAARDVESRKAEFNRLLTQGQQALTARKYPEAEKAFTQALALVPNDPTASKGLKDAKEGQRPNPQAEFARHFQAGQDADRQKRYADAVASYREALKIIPNEPKASAALKTADFNQHMETGKKQLAASKFPEAQMEFEAALQDFPTNAEAKALLQKAKDRKQ